MDAERKNWPVAVALVLVTLLVYSPLLGCGFVNYDDPQYVLNNPHVKAGLTLDGIGWAFSFHFHATNWHPLTWISHMLDVQLFGLNAWGHHLTNLLLHAANTFLLFGLLRQITGALWRSAFVAALFALHPLRVESVAWVAERKDVLAAFFFFLAVRAYVRFVQTQNEKSKIKNYLLALLFFASGLLSKPMVVTLPFVLLLLDFWPLNQARSADRGVRSWQRLVLEKIPFIALSLTSCAVTLWAQQKTIMTMQGLPVVIRFFNAVFSYARYLKKIIWPSDLAVLYPYPAHWVWPAIFVAGFFLVVATIAVIQRRREQPYLVTGWFWFLGMLVPVIGLVQVGVQSMADRYTYLPAIGVFIIIAWGVSDFFAERGYSQIVLKSLAVLAVIGCASVTLRQSGFWRDGETLFKHALAVTSNNAIAHYNLAMALLEQKKVDEAAEHFAEGARLMPLYPEMQNNLANILVIQGKRLEAVPHYEQALKSDPNHAVAHYNFGLTLAELGRSDEALGHLQQAVQLRPDFSAAHRDLGLALARKKDFSNSLVHLGEVIRLNPTNAEAHMFLGCVLLDVGNTNQAHSEFARALQIKPDLVEEFKQEAIGAQKQGELNSAADRLSAVLKLQPTDADTQRRLAVILSEQGKTE